MPASIEDDVRPLLATLTRQNPEWRLWLTLLEETLRAVDGPAWVTTIPQPRTDRPAAAPLLAGEVLAVDARRVLYWVRRLVKTAAKSKDLGAASLAGINFDHLDVLALLEAAACQDHARVKALASVVGVDPRTLGAIAQLAVMPLLQVCGRHLARQVPLTWSSGYCPVCGAWATLVEARGLDRIRRLRCARCGGDWGAAWLRCPYCGEADHRRLGFLAPDGRGETRKVEICMSCKGYIKTLTTLQAIPPYAVALEDLATVDLDVVALERGYTRPEQPSHVLGVCLIDSPTRMRAFFGRQR